MNIPDSIEDLVVLIICEFIAAPFCIAAGEAFVNQHYLRGVVGFAVGLPLAVAGFTFHWWKTWLTEPRRAWIKQSAERWWPVAAFVLLIYVCGPDFIQRLSRGKQEPVVLPAADKESERMNGINTFLNGAKIAREIDRVNAPCKVRIIASVEQLQLRNTVVSLFGRPGPRPINEPAPKCLVIDDAKDRDPESYSLTPPTPISSKGITVYSEAAIVAPLIEEALTDMHFHVTRKFVLPPLDIPKDKDTIVIEIGRDSLWN